MLAIGAAAIGLVGFGGGSPGRRCAPISLLPDASWKRSRLSRASTRSKRTGSPIGTPIRRRAAHTSGFDEEGNLGTVIWGAFEEPLELARVVHNLEHGGIIFYGEDVPDATVAELRAFYNATSVAPCWLRTPSSEIRSRSGPGLRRAKRRRGTWRSARGSTRRRSPRSSAGSSSGAERFPRTRSSRATTSPSSRRSVRRGSGRCSTPAPRKRIRAHHRSRCRRTSRRRTRFRRTRTACRRPLHRLDVLRARTSPNAPGVGHAVHAELADLDGAGLRAGLHAVGLDPLERVRRALFRLELNHRRNDVRSAGTVRRAEEACR